MGQPAILKGLARNFRPRWDFYTYEYLRQLQEAISKAKCPSVSIFPPPKLDGSVKTSRGKIMAVRTKGDGGDSFRMTFQNINFPTRSHFPDSDRGVLVSRGEVLAISAEGK